jgi:hypothetical protein
MTSRLLGLILLISVLASAASASAHEKFRLVGPIVKVDWTKNLLTMKGTYEKHTIETEILVPEKLVVTRDGKKVPHTALKPGLYIVMDALGDDVFDLEATAIKIVPTPSGGF